MCVLIFVLFINNIFSLLTSPINATINLIFLSITVYIAIMYGKQKQKENYDYDRENPNALTTGRNIAGTVYSSYPGNTPGLGWVL